MQLVIAENKSNSRKLWNELGKTLNKVPQTKLPPSSSNKSLADHFATFFTNKIKVICNKFTSHISDSTLLPPSEPPSFPTFTPVTEDDVCKTIRLPSITKLVTYSLGEGLVPEGF